MHVAHNGVDHTNELMQTPGHEVAVVVTETDASEYTTTEVGHDETTADAGVLASLGINGPLFLFQLLNFAIVAVILWFLILKPLTKKMEERKNIIDESLDRAKEVETNLKMSEVKFQEKLEQAKKESNEIVASAQEEATRVQESMKQKTKDDVEALVVAAKKNIEIEKTEMQANLRKETVEIVVAAMEKILNEKMDDKKDKKFVEDILKTIK
ncbi:MAG: F0F1 ATP synthase subunit B [Candidatus Magasanikbacteria bacterium]|nr:F0F1 ATP synthase subunit B [Candidatus Magasanikbacteria bacterium]